MRKHLIFIFSIVTSGCFSAHAQVNCQALIRELQSMGPGAGNYARMMQIQQTYRSYCEGQRAPQPQRQYQPQAQPQVQPQPQSQPQQDTILNNPVTRAQAAVGRVIMWGQPLRQNIPLSQGAVLQPPGVPMPSGVSMPAGVSIDPFRGTTSTRIDPPQASSTPPVITEKQLQFLRDNMVSLQPVPRTTPPAPEQPRFFYSPNPVFINPDALYSPHNPSSR